MKTIILELDEQTAKDLYWSLLESGEHIAAGAPLSIPSTEECLRLRKVMDELGRRLKEIK